MRRAKGSVPESDLKKSAVLVSAVPFAARDQEDATLEHLFRRLASEQIAIEPTGISQQSAAPRFRSEPAMRATPRASVRADVDRLGRELAAEWRRRRNASSR